MRINSLVTPYHLHSLVQKHYNYLTEINQKFLINMLVACDTNATISTKQAVWLENLIAQMKKMDVIATKKRSRPKRVDHTDHEVQVRAGAGPHPGRLWCVKCNQHIQWITQAHYEQLLDLQNTSS